MIPDLVPYADAQDGGENWIAYKHKENGLHFVNGPEGIKEYGATFSSKELHNCPGSLMAEVIAHKNEFPISTVESGSVTTPWDDLATHPDDIPVKPDTPVKREAAKKIKSAVKTMEAFKK
jgi:hypothetical protein